MIVSHIIYSLWFLTTTIMILAASSNIAESSSNIDKTSSKLTRSRDIIQGLKPSEIALLQFDSRRLEDYWRTSAVWNDYYAKKHGHQFLYYSLINENCKYTLPSGEKEELANAWCKVLAMIQASRDFPQVKVFIYMDSDAVISKTFESSSLNDLLLFMQHKLSWDVMEKPMVFNQDGPCWWCKLIKKAGYSMCLNAGTVMWYRHLHSDQILQDWWHSTMDNYADNPLKRKFRTKWPWEQDRQMALFYRSPEHIQIASHPDYPMLIREKQDPNSVLFQVENRSSFDGSTMQPDRDGSPSIVIKDWCLSHLPGCGCFINHFCANPTSKQKMRVSYKLKSMSYTADSELPFKIHELKV